jgi:hypothetical protein
MRAIYLAFALATIFVIPPEASAEPNKDQYELQERCGKRAEEAFKTEEQRNRNFTYQNHYSTRLNKCFVLKIVTSFDQKSDEEGISTIMTLFDLNEHKEYGTFYMKGGSFRSEGYGTFVETIYSAPFPCNWNEQHEACHSASEWREWLKPYMEE